MLCAPKTIGESSFSLPRRLAPTRLAHPPRQPALPWIGAYSATKTQAWRSGKHEKSQRFLLTLRLISYIMLTTKSETSTLELGADAWPLRGFPSPLFQFLLS